DDEARHAKAEAAPVVEVDHLEGQDGAPAEVVEEDPGLDDPELARQAVREAPESYVTVQRSHLTYYKLSGPAPAPQPSRRARKRRSRAARSSRGRSCRRSASWRPPSRRAPRPWPPRTARPGSAPAA